MNQELLVEILEQNPPIAEVVQAGPELELPNYYVASGCLTQTVWNRAHERDLASDIKDVDLVYFDTDLSVEREAENQKRVRERFAHIPLIFDVKNEARVHLWYLQGFGHPIPPYASVEDAITTFPTTATAIGVRKEAGGYKVYAPFGLDDLFGLIVRPNKRQITREIYERKIERWRKIWPSLNIIPWDAK